MSDFVLTPEGETDSDLEWRDNWSGKENQRVLSFRKLIFWYNNCTLNNDKLPCQRIIRISEKEYKDFSTMPDSGEDRVIYNAYYIHYWVSFYRYLLIICPLQLYEGWPVSLCSKHRQFYLQSPVQNGKQNEEN